MVARHIVGFVADEVGDWVACLDCLHRQHVRDRSPLWPRPWVREEAGRAAHVGTMLDCPLCARCEIPDGLVLARTTTTWDESTLPAALRRDHRVAAGTWGRLVVHDGELRFVARTTPPTDVVVTPGATQGIPPGVEHRVEPLAAVRFAVEFLAPMSTVTALDAANLGGLGPAVRTPAYDRDRVVASIVHLGVGGFHRAHQAMYLDRVLRTGDHRWGICGVGVLAQDVTMRDALDAQDGLYTLVTTAPDGERRARVIGSIVEYLFAPDDPAAVVAKMAAPTTRIVSMTITEGGYGIDATGEFAPSDPSMLTDLARGSADAAPCSALGMIVAALRARRTARATPFTVMSCDNIQGNGHVARAAIVAFAARRDPELAEWIATEVVFPNSMVDRITPVTTDTARAAVAAQFGIEDRWPVCAESFTQWVLEDRFTMGRPPLETVGVQLVDDVEPYELMKLRLLNATHQAMSHLGILQGATHVHEVSRDPLFRDFLVGYMRTEARPTLRPVPGIDLDEYCAELLARFGNEAIGDTLARLTVDSSDRIPMFLLPVVRAQLDAGGSIDHAALVLAGWSRFLEGVADDGRPIAVVDRRVDELRAAVATERHSPGAFLDLRTVFGDLGANPRLREAFVDARSDLVEHGARAALRSRRR